MNSKTEIYGRALRLAKLAYVELDTGFESWFLRTRKQNEKIVGMLHSVGALLSVARVTAPSGLETDIKVVLHDIMNRSVSVKTAKANLANAIDTAAPLPE